MVASTADLSNTESGKFGVINRIEETYFEVRPFVEEWGLLKQEDPVKRRWRDRYTELSFVEQAVPPCIRRI
jgi:hypothetical protein